MSSRSKNILIAALILLVLINAFVLIVKSKIFVEPEKPKQSQMVGHDVLIEFDGKTFSPQRVHMYLGDKIAFKNNSNKKIEIFSDPHPSHFDNDVFNAIALEGNKSVKIIKPIKSGTFSFHTESNNTIKAIVQIGDADISEINKSNLEQAEYLNPLVKLIDAHDPNSVELVFQKILVDPNLKNSCHAIGHDLGHRMYELFGLSGSLNLQFKDQAIHLEEVCSGGYFHGVLEEASVHDESLVENVESFCSRFSNKNRSSCFHGMGHAIMFHHERDLQASLEYCRKIKKDLDRWAAYEGVWMEYFWGDLDYFGKDKIGWNTDNPLASCQKITDDSQSSCYLYALFGYLKFHPKDFKGAVKLSFSSNLSDSAIGLSMKGIGLLMLGSYPRGELWRSETIVADLDEAYKKAFYRGVLGYAIFSGLKKPALVEIGKKFTNDADLVLKVLDEL